jgi:hypothetical protein
MKHQKEFYELTQEELIAAVDEYLAARGIARSTEVKFLLEFLNHIDRKVYRGMDSTEGWSDQYKVSVKAIIEGKQ